MQKGKKFLSDLKLYSDYLKWVDNEGRYETWDEAVESIINGHRKKYVDKNIENDLEFVLTHLKEKRLLASQRNLQYRFPQIEKNNARLYNCSSLYAARNKIFQEVFFLGLSGCGVGISLLTPFVDNISKIQKRVKGVKTYIIPDSIEGWANSLGVLMSSYFVDNQPFESYAGYEIKFDYSFIRPKGAFISGGFKSPGPDGLKTSLEMIETFIENWLVNNGNKLRPIAIADILCIASDAVLSGGIRRSALNMIVDPNDQEMINAKIGNWREKYPYRARSNNSVLLLRNEVNKEQFDKIISLNDGISDIGYVFANSWFDLFNPCYEILKHPILYKKINKRIDTVKYNELYSFTEENRDKLGVSFCNLVEINAEKATNKEEFYDVCRAASILGTLQAGYTNFPYLGKTTEEIVKQDALLGVSITGILNNPILLNKELLNVGASIVKTTNKRVAKLIKINQAARTTCIKPSGNSSVILGTASGIHPEHSEKYFRIMQLNKETETAKWLEKNMPSLLEESYWSSTRSDYAVFIPIENPKTGLFKKDVKGVKHLEIIKLVQENWVNEGTNRELCAYPNVNHNVSNTVIIDNKEEVVNYIWENKESFTANSFISDYGDKEFIQAPFTSVSSLEEIVSIYGKGAIFASGLIVDGLHYFNNDLWTACDSVKDKTLILTGTREQVLLKKYWLTRVKKFAHNFFSDDIQKTIYCLKDIHLLHKWDVINRETFNVDFGKILVKPEYKEVSKYSAVACSGGACEITRF